MKQVTYCHFLFVLLWSSLDFHSFVSLLDDIAECTPNSFWGLLAGIWHQIIELHAVSELSSSSSWVLWKSDFILFFWTLYSDAPYLGRKRLWFGKMLKRVLFGSKDWELYFGNGQKSQLETTLPYPFLETHNHPSFICYSINCLNFYSCICACVQEPL